MGEFVDGGAVMLKNMSYLVCRCVCVGSVGALLCMCRCLCLDVQCLRVQCLRVRACVSMYVRAHVRMCAVCAVCVCGVYVRACGVCMRPRVLLGTCAHE